MPATFATDPYVVNNVAVLLLSASSIILLEYTSIA